MTILVMSRIIDQVYTLSYHGRFVKYTPCHAPVHPGHPVFHVRMDHPIKSGDDKKGTGDDIWGAGDDKKGAGDDKWWPGDDNGETGGERMPYYFYFYD